MLLIGNPVAPGGRGSIANPLSKTPGGAMKIDQIERIDRPSMEVFHRDYVEPGRPVILNRGLGNCKARSWTPDYLCSVVGQKKMRVAISSSDGVFGMTTKGLEFKWEEIEFSRAAALMSAPGQHKYYMMQIPVREQLAELVDDIRCPAVIDPDRLRVINFWLSGAGDITALHFDHSNNLLAQIHGRKELTLFPPDQSQYLYPLPFDAPYPHVSRVNFVQPDPGEFPLFSRATPLRFSLEAGDVLFLPPYWWHGVKSSTMSISLNFWWNISRSQFFVPIMLERLVTYERAQLRNFPPVGGDGLIDMASYALVGRNLIWAGCLLATAALEKHWRKLLGESNTPARASHGQLEGLNAEVAKQTNAAAIDSAVIQEWMDFKEKAKAADDSLLNREAVAAMVSDIRQIITPAGLIGTEAAA